MGGKALHFHHSGGRVEVFIVQAAQGAAVHSIGIIAAKAFHVKVIGALADFLVRGKADLHSAVGLALFQDLRRRAEDLRHAGFVVAAQ